MEEWISLREFARRREVTLGAVQKAIESGRVTAVKRNGNGRLVGIEFHAATAQWGLNTDPDQAARAGQSLERLAELPLVPNRVANSPPADDAGQVSGDQKDQSGGDQKDQFGFLQARAREKEFQAKQAELDYLKSIGLVVSADELQRVNARRYKMLRDKFLNIADRIATVVAAERDPVRVHAAITAEIKRVLNELSDDAAAEAAGGVAERVAA
jgi:hypothetical protein